jgi:hypothetical protein
MASSRIFVASAGIAAMTSAKTLFYFEVASTMCVRVLETHVTNRDNDTNEQAIIAWQRVNSANGSITSTGSADVFEPELGQAAHGLTNIKYDVLTNDHTYLAPKIGYQAFALLSGYHVYPPAGSDHLFTINPSGLAGLKLLAAITSSQLDVEIWFEVIGG